MKKEVAIVLGNALIWGAVLVGCSVALQGTDSYQEIQHILAGGAAASLLVVGMIVVKGKPRG